MPSQHGLRPIYLDHNATTPLLPDVAEAMADAQGRALGNPSSQHSAGRLARRLLEDAREEIAAALGAELSGPRADRMIFTSGGTEANNLAILGVANDGPCHIVTSGIEHPSVRGPAGELVRRGGRWTTLPTTPEGTADISKLSEIIADHRPRLIGLMWANNDTGVLQPIERVAALGKEEQLLVHSDAVQAVGKLPIRFRHSGLALLTAAAHKLHGPLGIGLLLVRHDVPLRPILFGGPQEQELRAGTPAVALAVGFQVALRLASRQMQARLERLAAIQAEFEQTLKEGAPNLVVHGARACRLSTTSCISLPGCDRRAMLMALDLAGVRCSSGSACASGSEEPSPTLVAMGCSEAELAGSLRFSFGATTTADEARLGVERILRIYNELRGKKTSTNSPAAARH